MHVVNLCLTYNRHKCLQRALKCFLDQDYEGDQTLVIYNSGKPIHAIIVEEKDLPSNKNILLINNNKDQQTKEEYTNVGSKFRDILETLEDADVLTHFDDDDIFLPCFNRLGVEGFKKVKELGYKAYKTYFSYFRTLYEVTVEANTFEPSMFIDFEFIKQHRYLPTNVTFHDGWLKPLLKDSLLFVDRVQQPLFIYDWHPELRVHKMSGLPDTDENFQLSKDNSTDEGNGTLIPLSSNQRYYDLIKTI